MEACLPCSVSDVGTVTVQLSPASCCQDPNPSRLYPLDQPGSIRFCLQGLSSTGMCEAASSEAWPSAGHLAKMSLHACIPQGPLTLEGEVARERRPKEWENR